MEKYCEAGQDRLQMSIWRIACWIPKVKNTHSEYVNTYCFYVVTRTCLGVTLTRTLPVFLHIPFPSLTSGQAKISYRLGNSRTRAKHKIVRRYRPVYNIAVRRCINTAINTYSCGFLTNSKL